MSSILADLPETADVETSSEDYARRFSGQIGAWFLSVQEQATLRMIAAHPNASVLDVGGGHGQVAGALVRNGHRVTVLGSADVCEARIRSLTGEARCRFQVGNILSLPFPDQSFDVVISYRLLPHVSQWKRFLVELSRVAQTAVIVDYPAVRSLNYLAPQLFRLKRQLEGNTRPYACFEESQLLRVLASCGFVRADRCPEFFLPMALHRALKRPTLSSAVEKACRQSGLTTLLGSPVVLKAIRQAR